jgi:prepilin-type N-terminal cleavage/methylation domain-containing protein
VKEKEFMARQPNSRRQGFSLIELVIVVVIIGIIAAIAIPRMSRGTAAAGDSALAGNLSVLRNAIELYTTEHGGTLPTGTGAQIADKLTKYTNDAGTTSDTKSASYPYGPYLRKIPPVPVGTLKSNASVNSLIVPGTTIETTPTGGWLYDTATGNLKVNLADGEQDQSGKSYNLY